MPRASVSSWLKSHLTAWLGALAGEQRRRLQGAVCTEEARGKHGFLSLAWVGVGMIALPSASLCPNWNPLYWWASLGGDSNEGLLGPGGQPL